MAHWRLFYHFVWTTKNRQPLLTPDIQIDVYKFIHTEVLAMNAQFFEINGMMDHCHILTAIPPKFSPADFMKQIKGSSSRFITAALGKEFYWQKGYGVYSVSESHVPRIQAYVRNQKQHHADNTIVDRLEETNDWNFGPNSN